MKLITTSLFLILLLFVACGEPPSKKKTSPINGETLSHMYCASCHKYPDPELLDKETWANYMLPRMGYMYGIYSDAAERESLFENNEGGTLVRERNIFPKKPQLDSLEWMAIKNFYLNNAPDSLITVPPKHIKKSLSNFKAIFPKQKVSVPSSTMVQFSTNGSIYLGDAMTKSFSIFSKDLELLNSGNVQEGAVSIFDDDNAFWLTVMGSFSPTDAPLGLIAILPKNDNDEAAVPISKLQRPVHSSYKDLDGDGDMDIVVAEFGKWTGSLSFFRKDDKGYAKEILHPFPGAIKAYIRDMNGDGIDDIVALFAQGDEGIDIYYNDGRANFVRKRVLSFSPSMGSSTMSLIDYNDDGFTDILYTAGDNADYKPVLKPWHGVYVFLNDGKNNFNEELFEPLNGAYGAAVEDFDLDGDKDIAAISFFPDWINTPEESFVYFENDGHDSFSLSTFPEVNKGRWVVMDVSDYDQDGDKDIILGALAFEVVPKLGYVNQWVKDGIPFVVLENNTF